MFLKLKKVTNINSTSIDPSGRVYATDKPVIEEIIINDSHIVSVKEVEMNGVKHCKLHTTKGDYLVVGSAKEILDSNALNTASVSESEVTGKKLIKG